MKSLSQIIRENESYVRKPRLPRTKRPRVGYEVVEKYDEKGALIEKTETTHPPTIHNVPLDCSDAITTEEMAEYLNEMSLLAENFKIELVRVHNLPFEDFVAKKV